MERTIEFAIERASDADGDAVVHIVRTAVRPTDATDGAGSEFRHGDSSTTIRPAQDSPLYRLASGAQPDAPDSVRIETAVLGADTYFDDPADHVAAFREYGAEIVDLVVLDPNYAVDATAPALHPIEPVLSATGLPFERAPVSTPRPRIPLTRPELVRTAAVFVLTYAFYLALGSPSSTFDLVSGGAVALLAGVVLRNVTFETTPLPGAVPLVVFRAVLFIPYLLWEIAKANAQFAYVVLHPSLPIDPRVDRIDTAVDSGLSVTGLANSITLTPGTLTVDADGSELLVHSLDAGSRDALLEGDRERAIRFVFAGRDELDAPGPRERGDSCLLVGPDGEGIEREEVTDDD